jgi:hypothetical protein
LKTSPGPEITSNGIRLNEVILKPRNGVSNEFILLFPGVTNQSSGLGIGIYPENISQNQFAQVDVDLIDSRDGGNS